jgi:hypothetical protein
MAGLVDSLENSVLDAILGGSTTYMPDPIYIGLMTSEPNDDGTGVVEPSGGSYARVSVANNLTQWPAASGGQKSNANAIEFPTATAAWGVITHYGIFNAVSGGNLLAFGALTVSKDVQDTDIFSFLATTFVVALD